MSYTRSQRFFAAIDATQISGDGKNLCVTVVAYIQDGLRFEDQTKTPAEVVTENLRVEIKAFGRQAERLREAKARDILFLDLERETTVVRTYEKNGQKISTVLLDVIASQVDVVNGTLRVVGETSDSAGSAQTALANVAAGLGKRAEAENADEALAKAAGGTLQGDSSVMDDSEIDADEVAATIAETEPVESQ